MWSCENNDTLNWYFESYLDNFTRSCESSKWAKIVFNFVWLTTLMPSSDYKIQSFELKLNKKIPDEVDKRFLSENGINFSDLDYVDFRAS